MLKVAKAHKLQGRVVFQGLEISIENRKGSRRYWYDPHGKEKGSTLMHWSYGYIRRTRGTDGDHVDVYIGPNPSSTKVFVINQMKKPEGAIVKDGKPWTRFDEQKCMLGWDSAAEAKSAYLKQYDDPRFFGSMKEMSMDEFKSKVLDPKNHGKKVAALLGSIRSRVETPAVTSYAKTTHGSRLLEAVKSASISDRVDDAGIGLLAAPYAADVASKSMLRLGGRNPKVRAAATALKSGLGSGSAFGKSHGRELTGLALVAPGVTHTVARGIEKTKSLGTKKTAALVKIAESIYDDWEYLDEDSRTEKLSGLLDIGRLALQSPATRRLGLAAGTLKRPSLGLGATAVGAAGLLGTAKAVKGVAGAAGSAAHHAPLAPSTTPGLGRLF